MFERSQEFTSLVMEQKVTITESGRSGAVIYHGSGGQISGWWEFAGGNTLAIVGMGGLSEWEHGHTWAVDRRSEILRFVAEEVVRQKAGGRRYTLDEDSGFIEIV